MKMQPVDLCIFVFVVFWIVFFGMRSCNRHNHDPCSKIIEDGITSSNREAYNRCKENQKIHK